jgi:hypothetical protein
VNTVSSGKNRKPKFVGVKESFNSTGKSITSIRHKNEETDELFPRLENPHPFM